MKRHLQQLFNLQALPPDSQIRPKEGAATSYEHPELKQFQDAGWVFLESAHQSVPAGDARPVYRDSSGHISIGGNTLVLEFEKGASLADVDRFLAQHHLEVIRRIGKRKLSMLLRTMEQPASIVDYCDRLQECPEVRWCEANLVESIDQRSLK
ncbi:MAG: hypothetical protein DBO99_06090 [gamma proteobacterium symbiont of Ctena orbiculata]|nr:MAG: hypothetical protein DBO99_06090 [gamma proteobacterium symbiont of Ctena orbiculata]